MEPSHTGSAPARRRAAPLRLFVMPLLIVVALVWIWMKIRLPAHEKMNPRQLVREIARLDDGSWLKAYALTRLLAETNDSNLGADRALCGQVSSSLAAELEAANPSSAHVRLRVFLCRALGEFRVDDGLATLVRAAANRPRAAADVRYAALQSIAVLADRLGSTVVRAQPGVLDVVLQATRASGPTADHHARDEVRSAATFTLGVLGGDAAMNRLADLTNDGYANTRFNAATGLARMGDRRAVPVLVEMLDPSNSAATEGEPDRAASRLKQSLVMVNAVRATVRLAQKNRAGSLEPLRDALRRVVDSSQVSTRVRLDARDALSRLDASARAPGTGPSDG